MLPPRLGLFSSSSKIFIHPESWGFAASVGPLPLLVSIGLLPLAVASLLTPEDSPVTQQSANLEPAIVKSTDDMVAKGREGTVAADFLLPGPIFKEDSPTAPLIAFGL